MSSQPDDVALDGGRPDVVLIATGSEVRGWSRRRAWNGSPSTMLHITREHSGASAANQTLYAEFGITPLRVAEAARTSVARQSAGAGD